MPEFLNVQAVLVKGDDSPVGEPLVPQIPMIDFTSATIEAIAQDLIEDEYPGQGQHVTRDFQLKYEDPTNQRWTRFTLNERTIARVSQMLRASGTGTQNSGGSVTFELKMRVKHRPHSTANGGGEGGAGSGAGGGGGGGDGGGVGGGGGGVGGGGGGGGGGA